MDTDHSKDISQDPSSPAGASAGTYDETVQWKPQAPRFGLTHLLLSWVVAAGAVFVAVRSSCSVCVAVRDLIVFGVLTDMMRGRPAVYATFSSYDEVAHHSGLERADTLEALRKLDQRSTEVWEDLRRGRSFFIRWN
ncbi:MAG: hypothetical protein WBP81_14880 [Solirubrobacteraceae bacterium]